MKNFVVIALLSLTLFTGSCVKNIGTPFSYAIDTVTNAYVNNNDSLLLSLRVKFLAGNPNEVVKLTIAGLPGRVKLAQDTISGTGTFYAQFWIKADSAVIGNYPVVLVSYSKSTGYRYSTFNLGVVHNDCSSYLIGDFTGSNSCMATNYTYTATVAAATGTAINILNIGGYGSNTSAYVTLNCNTDSIYLARQDIGNGITMWGQGHFSGNQIVISYVALHNAGNYNDTCTAILNR